MDSEEDDEIRDEIEMKYNALIKKATADSDKKILDQKRKDAEELDDINSKTAIAQLNAQKETELAFETTEAQRLLTEKKYAQLIIDEETRVAVEKAKLEGKSETEINALIAQVDSKKIAESAKTDKQMADNSKKVFDETVSFAESHFNQMFSMITQASKQSSDAQISHTEADKNAALASIDAQLQAANITEAQKDALTQKRADTEASYNEKEADEKRKAWNADHDAAIVQATINGAVAVTKAWAELGPLGAFGAAVVTTETLAQIAIITAQQPPAFHTGGLVGADNQDEIVALLKKGETVRTPQQEGALQNNQGNGKGVTIIYNNYSSFTDVQAVKKAVEQGLRQSNLPVEQFFVNANKGMRQGTYV